MPLVLVIDDRKAVWAAAALVPRGGLVVVRARDAQARLALAQSLGGLAPLLIADDPELALRIGAAGLHLPKRACAKRRTGARCIRGMDHHVIGAFAARPDAARRCGCGLPVAGFRHRQSQGRAAFVARRAAFIAAHAMVPVYALERE